MSMLELLPEVWQKEWDKQSYGEPTLIQSTLYPLLLESESVLGISPTGSGKTVAYLLPLLQKVIQGNGNQLLIILPSQELASQVADVTRVWAKGLELNVQAIIGGANVKRQIERLKKRPEVLVGTPGRVLELIKLKKIKAHLIQTLVLDEVDDLLSDADFNSTKGIIKSVQADTQIVATSATGEQILPRMDTLFRTELRVIDVTEEDNTKGSIQHGFIMTPVRKRSEVLRRLAHVEGFKGLVFFNQVSELGAVSERLNYLGIKHQTLASDQHQVERKRAIHDFEIGQVSLLLTTDLGARGLDFSDLDYVIQYDLAQSVPDYIHRAGRVGRMGKQGTVISLVNDGEKRELNRLYKEVGKTGTEFFATHGRLVTEKPDTHTEEESKEVRPVKEEKEKPIAKKEESNREKMETPKKKKKKNRTKKQKNKGAKWK
ncbi:DEAD/DEAH box helicase [Vagococcus luciliae]|uniref:DEAD-box ATP-dependent RNA helicase CshC n=1 Tax=Vagococcus luciliae TaxID=2920380 RepID=A0ABY5NZ08_9ENTE|nr:DEAD/DEAH box helicase [Vagococcus luciliae]UUV98633.1 DEAD-box ATP-dependent RNA helicase CshC [Vagococcus luciliae]